MIDRNNLKTSMLFNTAAILLVDDKPIDPKYLESLSIYSQARPIIRLKLDSYAKEKQISGVNFSDELVLKSKERLKVREQVIEYLVKASI